MFDHLKASVRSRRQPRRPQSEMLHMRRDENAEASKEKIEAAIGVLQRIRGSRSLREILHPPIRQPKPLTPKDIFKGLSTETTSKMAPVGEEIDPNEVLLSAPTGPPAIKRKPCPGSSSGSSTDDTFVLAEHPKFDPRALLTDRSIHKVAREVLKRRYQSKFTLDFEPAPGASLRDYDFLWVSAAELERKVVEDIVWVRERYAQANKEEPSDEDVIFWYTEEDEDS